MIQVSDTFFFWILLALFFLILEMGHPGLFFFLSFCISGALSGLVSLFDERLAVQLAVFFVTTIAAFFILNLWVKKLFAHKHALATNTHALIGKQGLVVKIIGEHQSGQVQVGGQIWSARSLVPQAIACNVLVDIIEIKGVHLIVRPAVGKSV